MFKRKWRTTPEFFCQAINIIVLFNYIKYIILKNREDNSLYDVDLEYHHIMKMLEMAIFVRGLKVVIFFYEIKEMQIIFETMRGLLRPIFQIINVLLLIYYIFALIGMFIFGGKNRKGIDVFE